MRNTDPAPKPRRSVLVPFLIFLVVVFAGLYVMDNPRFAGGLQGLGATPADTAPSPTPAASAAGAVAPIALQAQAAPQPAAEASESVPPLPQAAASQPIAPADAIPLKFPSGPGSGSAAGSTAPGTTGSPPAPARGQSMMVPDAPQEKANR